MNRTIDILEYFDTGILTLFCALIFYLSHQSGLPVVDLFPHQDKVVHFGEYAVLGILAWRCFRHYVKNIHSLFLISLLFCSVYGALDEFHQWFIPNRQTDILDWLADTVGAGLSITMMALLRLKNPQHQLF